MTTTSTAARLPARPQAWPEPPTSVAGPRARLLWYPTVARWAPSKHNTQPWRFVVRDDSLEIWADPSRALPASDPHMRELVLSCGAALHHVEVAAHALGRQVAFDVLPDGGLALVARLVESGTAPPAPHDLSLLASVPRRRTDRGPLDRSSLSLSLPFQLQSAASLHGGTLRLVTSAADRAALADLVERADRLQARRGGVDRELEPWLRDPRAPASDGVPRDRTRGAAASYRAEFVQRDFAGTASVTSRAAHGRAGHDHPLVAVLCTGEDTPADWVTAGRALSAVLLEAAVAGVSASYLNQPVEEATLRTELRTALRLPGEAQLVLRLGVGGDVPATPRRPVEDMRSVV